MIKITMYVRTDDKFPLVSDGQQFHHYEQNEQSPLTSTHWTTTKITRHMTLEIQILIWDRHTNMARLK